MDLSGPVLQKIRSEELRSEAMADATRAHTVIVELSLPMPRLEAVAPLTPTLRGRPRFRIAEASEPPTAASPEVRASGADIATITGAPPRTYLPGSASFVVSANGAQIGRIAQMPSVSAIWPNARRRSVP